MVSNFIFDYDEEYDVLFIRKKLYPEKTNPIIFDDGITIFQDTKNNTLCGIAILNFKEQTIEDSFECEECKIKY